MASIFDTARNSVRRSHNNQAGVASILVTLVLMIVISLIVLGFAQVSRRTQREALDRQLSTQAFYAAESAVNGARNLIDKAIASGTALSNIPAKTDCTNDNSGTGFYSTLIGTNATLSTPFSVSYSCLLVNPAPTTLVYSDVGTTSTIVPLISGSGTPLSTVTLKWTPKTTVNLSGCPTSTATTFSTVSNWTCGYGVLRFDIVSVNGSLSSSSLQTSTMTMFAEPLNNSGTNSIAWVANGGGTGSALTGVKCNTTSCSLKVNGLVGPGGAQSDKFYMRVSSSYKDVSLQVSGTTSAGSTATLTGAQALIDATGKAQDVLRRIQVRVPLTGSSTTNQMPDNALQSTDSICKRFAVTNGYFSSDTNGDGSNQLCQ